VAGLSKASKGGKARPAMNVTPLVDIVLVLLIIFMVVLPNTEEGATVEPPTIEHGEDDPEGPDPFVLVVEDDGTFAFDQARMPVDQLTAALDAQHASDPERKLMLRADRDTRYEYIRTAFKLAQDVGFPGVMLRVNANPETNQVAEGG